MLIAWASCDISKKYNSVQGLKGTSDLEGLKGTSDLEVDLFGLRFFLNGFIAFLTP